MSCEIEENQTYLQSYGISIRDMKDSIFIENDRGQNGISKMPQCGCGKKGDSY